MKNKYKYIIICVFAVIIILQILYIVKTFAIDKTGEHSDEVWSYGLANSHDKPYIFGNNERTKTDVNVNKWINSKTLNDYVTVQKGERFDYVNVISNLKYDEHPPLYFMILHTICSFFPDTYSKWFAFPINIICFIITMIFLIMMTQKTTGNYLITLLCVLYYGFCAGGVSVYIFNRHYAMAAMFFVILLYYHFVLFESADDKIFKKKLIPVFIFSALGMLTLYLSAVATCILAGMCCFRLLGGKKYRKLLMYASTMLLSTIPMFLLGGILSGKISVDGFTNRSMSESTQESTSTVVQQLTKNIRYLMDSLLNDFTGLDRPTQMDYHLKIFFSSIAFFFIITLPFLILLYKDKKFSFKSIFARIKRVFEKIRHMGDSAYLQLSMAVMVIIFIFVIIGVTLYKKMGPLANRYIFCIYPVIAFIIVIITSKIIKFIYFILAKIICFVKNKRRKDEKVVVNYKYCNTAIFIIGVILMFFVVYKGEQLYLFPREGNEPPFEKLVENKDCALFLSENWLLTCYSDLLNHADNVFVGVSFDDNSIDALAESDRTPEYYIYDVTKTYGAIKSFNSKLEDENEDEYEEMLRGKVEKRYPEELRKEIDNEELEYVQKDIIFTRIIYVYRKK